MDLFNFYSDLVKETLEFKGFKGLHPAFRVLAFIVLLPFVVAYTGMLLVYLVLATIYKLAHSAFDFLYDFVHGEGKIVKHATQAVIYLVAFPLLFALKVVYSIIAFPIVIYHFVITHVGYVATFGGITYSPFIHDKVDRTKKQILTRHCKSAVVLFVVIGLAFLTLSLVFESVALTIYDGYKEYTIKSTLIAEMKEARADNEISKEEWNQFADAYNNGEINSENYIEFVAKYLKVSEYPVWNAAKEYYDIILIKVIYLIIIVTYLLFTVLYVSIYSNVMRRKQNRIAVSENDSISMKSTN